MREMRASSSHLYALGGDQNAGSGLRLLSCSHRWWKGSVGWLWAHRGAPEIFTCPRSGGLRSQLRGLAAVGHCRNEAVALLGTEEVTELCAEDGCVSLAGGCVPNPCLNGGTCVEEGAHLTCLCLPGYGGSSCERRESPGCQHGHTGSSLPTSCCCPGC